MKKDALPGGGMESLKLEIRRYKAEDQEEVFNLHKEAMIAAGSYLENIPDKDVYDIENVYLNSGGEFLVGTLGKKIVAMGAVRKISEDRGEIKRMRVTPGLWRQGLGEKILKKLEERARELGLKSLELDTFAGQVSNNFYIKNGYKEFKREIGKISGRECVFYKKML